MNKHVNLLLKKDCSRNVFIIVMLCFVALKFFLASRQMIYITPEGAPIDDTLMYNAAVSITQGNWLGEYNWLTLSKYMFFSVWVALLHVLNIPYLLGGQIVYAFACAVCVWAFASVVKRNVTRLGLMFFLLFNPAQTAAAVQLRVYRDNITGAFALLIFAGFVGAALRYEQSVKKAIPFLIFGGIGLTCSYLNREDGAWYLAFCVLASIVTCIFIIKHKSLGKKFLRCLLNLVPYAFLAVGIFAFCVFNYQSYGRFIVSDFTSKEFKDACGALMRVSASDTFEQKDKVPVSASALEAIYEEIPIFAQVEDKLKSFDIMRDYGAIDGDGEYSAGAFYWALRRAVYESGIANTAIEAQQFYESLAQQINSACDSGALPSGTNKISTTLMPFNTKYIVPVIKETFVNLLRMTSFDEASSYFEKISISPQDLQQQYEGFLKEESNISAKPYTDDAYYLPKQERAYFVFDALSLVYGVFVSVMFICAIVWQVIGTKKLCESIKNKTKWSLTPLWWVQLGLLASVLMRCAIVAYVFVTAFNANVGRIAYLCGAHPALLLFCFIGTLQLLKYIRYCKKDLKSN